MSERAFNLSDYYLFDRLDEGLGDKTAIIFGDRRYSYQDIASRTEELTAHLLGAGLAPERRVLVVLHDTPAFAWAFFAALRAGGVVAMGNPAAPADDLAYLVAYTKAAVVITNRAVAQAIAGPLEANGCHVVVVPEVATGGDVLADDTSPIDVANAHPIRQALEDGAQRIAGGQPGRRQTHEHDPAIWLFTSGSTGRSKAAMHCHRDFAYNTERYAVATMGYRRGDITVSVPRLFFGYATGTNLMFPFRVGATTGLFCERPTVAALAKWIAHYRPTIVTNVPTMMGKLLDDADARDVAGEPALDLSSVRFHLSAGEALPPALLTRFTKRFDAEIYDGIGSAEMFHIYCSNRPGDVMPGSLGKAVEGYEIKILPVDAEGPGAPESATDEPGVMWVKGDSVALGYFQDRAASWQTFFGHWCRTGDMFRRDERGYLWFEGRADDLLKVGGIWVAPVEVEHCVNSHPAVSSVAVLGVEMESLVKPKAYVVLREEFRAKLETPEGKAELAREIKDHVMKRLSKHKYPRKIVFVDDLPKNDRGKIARRQLQDGERAGQYPTGD